MLEKNRNRPSVTAALGHMTPARRNPVRQRVVYLRCPECDTLMTRRNFGLRSGIIVDICPGHGVWFDHGELEAVMRFVRAGGLQEPPPGPVVSNEAVRELLNTPGKQGQRTPARREPLSIQQALRDIEDFVRTVIEEVRE